MKLNIHTISHPIVQHLSSITEQKNNLSNTQNQTFKLIGSFLIYETIRNWLKIYKLTIKNTTLINHITVIDPKESFTIISDTSINLNLIHEAQYLLPKCNIRLTSIDQNLKNSLKQNLPIPDEYNKIIIVTSQINYLSIVQLIDELIDHTHIHIKQIRLACIRCTTQSLIEISNKYPKLNIFTTNIINKNK